MEEIICKEESNVVMDQHFSSLFIKEEIRTLEYEDNSDAIKIKNEIDHIDYEDKFNNYIDRSDYIKQELTHEMILKTEISRDENDTFPLNNKVFNYKKKSKQVTTKQIWLNRVFKRLKQRLIRSNGKTLVSGTSSNAVVQTMPSPRNVCVICLYCVKQFFTFRHFWNHFIGYHLIIKFPNLKTDIDSKETQYLIKREDYLPQSTEEKYPNLPIDKQSLKFQKCNICFKRFKTEAYLKIHMYKHTWMKTFNCNICSKKFVLESSLNAHMKNLHTKPLKCEFVQESSLYEHINLHTFKSEQFTYNQLNGHANSYTGLKKLFECEICSKKFTRRYSLSTHMNLHTGMKSFKCEICFKELKYRRNLKKHMSTHDGIKFFKCVICFKEFSQRGNLNTHMKSHTGIRPFKCEICSKDFAHRHTLNKHLNSHTRTKSFKCEICSKYFTRRYTLNTHMKSHARKELYKCEICSKELKHKRNLNIHMSIHTGIKSFKCVLCSKEFTQSVSLYKHMFSHTPNKLFKCEICSKEYKYKDNLNVHMKLHTGVKIFNCEVCSKVFTRKSYLNSHMNSHTGVKPFKCEICSKEFTQKGSLNKHLKLHTQLH